jgi:hypothetical protein
MTATKGGGSGTGEASRPKSAGAKAKPAAEQDLGGEVPIKKAPEPPPATDPPAVPADEGGRNLGILAGAAAVGGVIGALVLWRARGNRGWKRRFAKKGVRWGIPALAGRRFVSAFRRDP